MHVHVQRRYSSAVLCPHVVHALFHNHAVTAVRDIDGSVDTQIRRSFIVPPPCFPLAIVLPLPTLFQAPPRSSMLFQRAWGPLPQAVRMCMFPTCVDVSRERRIPALVVPAHGTAPFPNGRPRDTSTHTRSRSSGAVSDYQSPQ